MKIKVQLQQNLFDIALQYLGSVEYAMQIALLNNISMTDDLAVNTVLEIPDIDITGEQQKVVKYYKSNPLKIPGTAEPNL